MVSALKNRKYGFFVQTFFLKCLENIFSGKLAADRKVMSRIQDKSILDIDCLAETNKRISEKMSNEDRILLGLYLGQYSPREIAQLLNIPHHAVIEKIEELKSLLSKPDAKV